MTNRVRLAGADATPFTPDKQSVLLTALETNIPLQPVATILAFKVSNKDAGRAAWLGSGRRCRQAAGRFRRCPSCCRSHFSREALHAPCGSRLGCGGGIL